MYRSVGCITGLGELCCVCVCPQLGGEVGEVNAMEKKMRIILTAGAVCVLPISISFPAVSYSPIVCVCVCYNTDLPTFVAGGVHVLDTQHYSGLGSDVASEETVN